MTKPILVFCHGWAFDPRYWDVLRPYLNAYPHLVWDLGYSGNLMTPKPTDVRGPLIGIGHSLGFAKLLESALPFTAVISLCGFLKFCRQTAEEKEHPPSRITSMIREFKRAPSTLLSAFYRSCGEAHFSLGPTPCYERLLSDLAQLSHLDARERWQNQRVQTLALSITDDPIMASSVINQQFRAQPLTKIIDRPGDFHILGRREAAWCAEQICEFIAPYTHGKT